MMRLSAASNRRSKSGLRVFNKTARSTQRVAVRITYVKPKTAGHWKAHGVYLQREAAAGKDTPGFNAEVTGLDIPSQLNDWQLAGDERLFRVIISPEQSGGLDLCAYTRETMKRVETDTHTRLQWIAVVHRNTDHPHVHLSIRGVDQRGAALTFSKDYVKTGFRTRAQEVATLSLGLRSPEEVEASLIGEATKDRMTSLDRVIQKNAEPIAADTLELDMRSEGIQHFGKWEVSRLFAIERRLYYLQTLGLAHHTPDDRWTLPSEYMTTLKSLTIAGDKQKMLIRHMEPASSVGQAIISAKWNDIKYAEARVLGHSEDEATGKRFMLLERLDGTILHLPHRADTEVHRANHELGRNQVITIRRDRGRLVIEEHGSAEHILSDPIALACLSGVQPVDAKRPGWLGQLDAAAAGADVQRAGAEQAEPVPKLVAIRLSEEQVIDLLQEAYPDNAEARSNALAGIRDQEQNVALTDRAIEIQYSSATSSYFAEVTPRDKRFVDSHLTALSAQKRRRLDRPRDIERG